MTDDKDYLTIPEAAEICAVGRTTMWRWVKSGEVKARLTLGGHHRILKSDLEAVLAKKGAYAVSALSTKLKPKTLRPHPAAGKLLIVDDDPQVQKITTRFLSGRGYEVRTAHDGFEAGTRMMSFHPDMVILDLFMPGMDGFEVCSRIKRNPRTSEIKVLAVTGYDTEENRNRIMEAGADGYLAKPLERHALLEAVKTFLNGSVKTGAAG